ncbi:MAG: hypothetical protein ACOYNL_08425 [Rickettsiales bacterium]
MIKFLQRIGQGFKEFGRGFVKDFKEGYHSPMPEGGHGGVAGSMGTIIVGVPVAVAVAFATDFFSKKKGFNPSTNTSVTSNDSVMQAATSSTKSWVATEQAKAIVPEAQPTR